MNKCNLSAKTVLIYVITNIIYKVLILVLNSCIKLFLTLYLLHLIFCVDCFSVVIKLNLNLMLLYSFHGFNTKCNRRASYFTKKFSFTMPLKLVF